MKYDYSVIYNGKFYRAGEEVPMKENKDIAEEKAAEVSNEAADSAAETDEPTEEVKKVSENEPTEAKRTSKRTKTAKRIVDEAESAKA